MNSVSGHGFDSRQVHLELVTSTSEPFEVEKDLELRRF